MKQLDRKIYEQNNNEEQNQYYKITTNLYKFKKQA